MKRNVLVLVLSLLLLSFGLANADLTFRTELTGGYMDGSTLTINSGAPVFVDIYATNTTPPAWRGAWSSPFTFTGTGIVNPVTFTDTSTWVIPSFKALWDLFYTTWADLNTFNQPAHTANLPFLFNVSGAANNAGLYPTGTEFQVLHMGVTVTLTDPGTPGELCIAKGVPSDPTYDWLFEDPVPTYDPICWPVNVQPDPPPVFDNCTPGLTLDQQFNVPFTYTFTGHDVPNPDVTPGGIHFCKMSGVGDVTDAGVWTYNATCVDVDQSLSVVVGIGDANNPCGAVNTCTINIVVRNTAPTITCQPNITVGTSGGFIQYTAADINTGDTKTWSIEASDAPGAITVDGTGKVTFVPGALPAGDYNFTVRVTDCGGLFAECQGRFSLVLTNPFYVKIEKAEGLTGKGVLQGHHTLLNVYGNLNTADAEVWGWDFLIAYDASALSLMNVVKSDLFAIPGANEFEYLTYRFGATGNCGNGCPTGLVRVIAIADQNDGYHHPVSKVIPSDHILFQLDFLVSNDRTLECMFVPVRFFWTDCGDNTLAMRFPLGYGASNPPIPVAENDYDVITVLNSGIYEFDDPLRLNNIADGGSVFPTFVGAPDSCLTYAILAKQPFRLVDFINGGVDIICSGDIDARGDVNLNGISNEIGDAVVFTNYFIGGLAAFTVNIEGQIAATDVNADGTTLSVADLVYLIRVIVGDALPYAKLNPNAGAMTLTSNGSVLSTDVELGALYVVMNGHADVSLADGAANMQLKTGVIDGNTVALVYSFDKGQTCTGNVLNTNGTILRAEAANYEGSAYKTGIDNLPTSFSLTNYPNPFNPTTTISMALPVASNWTISIYNVVGQKVASFDGHSEAGIVNVNWDASNQASGVYFYKAEAGKFSATKKMALLK